MIEALPPGVILILGSLLIPLLQKRFQPVLTLVLPALGLAQLILLEPGVSHQLRIFDYELVVVRVDRLSLIFGYIFHLGAFLAAVYALDGEQIAFGPIVTTRMYCQEAARTERALLKGLRDVSRWVVDGDRLELLTDAGVTIAILEKSEG